VAGYYHKYSTIKGVKGFIMSAFNWIKSAVVISIVLVSCAPIPKLTSPRIISSCSVTQTFFTSSTEYSLVKGDTVNFSFKPLEFTELNALPNFGFSLFRRVQLSGYLFSAGEYVCIFGLDGKINICDVGKPMLFKNFAIAIYGGANVLMGEWDYNNYKRGGIILGTHTTKKHTELELVLIPTYFDNYITSSPGEATGIAVHERGLDITSGLIFWPFSSRLFQMNAGITYKQLFDESHRAHLGEGTVLEEFSPWIFQGSISINFPRKR
jgi:hypothetical protein